MASSAWPEDESAAADDDILCTHDSHQSVTDPFRDRGRHGKLQCEVCDMDPVQRYGADGERCIEVHHTIPINQLQPDSVTRVADLAVVCASCHRILHSKTPCLSVTDARKLIT